MNVVKLFFLVIGIVLISCQTQSTVSWKPITPDALVFSAEYSAQYPWLYVDSTKTVFMTWTEQLDTATSRLQYAQLINTSWGPANNITQGDGWFVNWADFPSLLRTADGRWVAHWLEKSAGGTYDYDVKFIQYQKDSASWGKPFTPHTDGIPAEHGFVSSVAMPNGNTLAVWLDGRNTKTEGHEHHSDGHGGGPMSLRSAQFDAYGNLSAQIELDAKVCDCCQTSAAMTAKGPVVVYRDRSDEEIRDISIVRFVNGVWTSPKPVFENNWQINGCPVNGPKVVAKDNDVVVAWFTGMDNKPALYASYSSDAGETFGDPVLISDKRPLGRLGLVWGEGKSVWMSWLEPSETEGKADLKLAAFQIPNLKIEKGFIVAQVSSSRDSGVPQLAFVNSSIVMAWTEPDSINRIKTVLIKDIILP